MNSVELTMNRDQFIGTKFDCISQNSQSLLTANWYQM